MIDSLFDLLYMYNEQQNAGSIWRCMHCQLVDLRASDMDIHFLISGIIECNKCDFFVVSFAYDYAPLFSLTFFCHGVH